MPRLFMYYVTYAIIDLIFSIIFLCYVLYIILLCQSLISWELPYVPTMYAARQILKKHLKIKKTDRVLDMGSGLGKMVLFFSRYPIHVTGIERKWYLYLFSKVRLFFHWFKPAKVYFIRGDFFQHPLKKYSIIYAFHIPRLIKRLVFKIEKELRKGQTLISYKFPFPLSSAFSEERVRESDDSYFYIYRRK